MTFVTFAWTVYTELVFLRCSYKYDALGSLYRKVCSDGGNYIYLVDPFGPYGPDIIAEVSVMLACYMLAMNSKL